MRDREVPAQLKPIVADLLRPKPEIFQGRYRRWYVRFGEKTREEHCPSFHTEEQARAWSNWSPENAR
jgi:hypothetical protein